MLGGSTKCESAEIIRWSAIACPPVPDSFFLFRLAWVSGSRDDPAARWLLDSTKADLDADAPLGNIHAAGLGEE